MNVLHDKREGTFAQISLAWLAHRTGRRVGPEGFVVGAPIIIAGEPKPARRPQNQERGREQKPARPPARFWPKPAMGRTAKDFRRIKWGDVVTKKIMGSLECRPGRINNERAKSQKHQQRL